VNQLASVSFALTLWRPWTALILRGSKSIENRPWPPPKWIMRMTIGIHAGEKFDDGGWLRAQEIMRKRGDAPAATDDAFWALAQVKGAIVGTARVVGWICQPAHGDGRFMSAPGLVEHFDDPWFFGPYGWILEDRRALSDPVPHRGAQKLWKINKGA
jgi:hypothetical protein